MKHVIIPGIVGDAPFTTNWDGIWIYNYDINSNVVNIKEDREDGTLLRSKTVTIPAFGYHRFAADSLTRTIHISGPDDMQVGGWQGIMDMTGNYVVLEKMDVCRVTNLKK